MRLCCLKVLVVLALFPGANRCFGQLAIEPSEAWPKPITLDSGAVIKVFKPEIIRYDRTVVQFKSVFSVLGTDPEKRLFGMAWVTARVAIDSMKGRLLVKAYIVDEVRIPDDPDTEAIQMIWAILKVGLQGVIKDLPLEEAKHTELAGVGDSGAAGDTRAGGERPRSKDGAQETGENSTGADSRELQVFFRTRPSVLVEMDGWPRVEYNERLRLDMVVNSSSPIVRDEDGKFYLYNAWHWYRSNAALGPYTYVSEPVGDWQKKIEGKHKSGPVHDMVISTGPALLIESDGDPQFKKIDSLPLSYVTNSATDIFLDTLTHSYYLLIGEKWYHSSSMHDGNQWTMVAPLDLPESFSQIPVSSEKRTVRSFVAGTDEAENRLADRQIPTMIRIDRYRTATVPYDGQPGFLRIKGTKLKYADNTCSIVLYDGLDYYTLFEGVWFIADNPRGFWTVSDHRPDDIQRIPGRYAVSRAKFVDVYGVSAESVWVGYLPGYLEGPYDSCRCHMNCTVGFPYFNAMAVQRLLARAKEGKVFWSRPQGFKRTGLFSKQYY